VQLFHLNLVGGVLMTLHSAQGPQMGIAQMIQSRAQPGSLGALLVLFLLSVISRNALNLYGSVLSVTTLLQTFAHRWIPTAQCRAGLMPING
jgi:purine-cytosine permease-like protein